MLLKDRQQTVSCSSLLCHLTISIFAPPHTHTCLPSPAPTPHPLHLTLTHPTRHAKKCMNILHIYISAHTLPPLPLLHSVRLILRLSEFASFSHSFSHTRARKLTRARPHTAAGENSSKPVPRNIGQQMVTIATLCGCFFFFFFL